ncbi:hypothetical protein MMC08_006121 [Hypocenomyce scalaris]|nr:hypothetical protein [Hypocenomyce scalaris]
MVFKPFTHLARQSFAKTFTHGYAQSVVAATQSSCASPFGNHHASRFSKPGTPQFQTAFQNTPSSANSGAKAGHTNSKTVGNRDGGLAAYYEAWQQQQHDGEGKEWKQYQFTKRIGWKATPAVHEGEGKDGGLRPEVLLNRGGLERAYSASAVDDIKQVEDVIGEADAVAQIDEAIAKEIQHGQVKTAIVDEQGPVLPAVQNETTRELVGRTSNNSLSNRSSPRENSLDAASSPFSDATVATSIHDVESQAFSQHISKLRDGHRYAEIPPVFESMLLVGHQPTATAYNALIDAAINLPTAKHQTVPKALDVYSDMLRRKVLPNSGTYTILLQLLSRRSLDVIEMKTAMEQKRIRFGGMKEAGKFMFSSQSTEYDILHEDDALGNAIKLFSTSITMHQDGLYSAKTYHLLISACAARGQVEDMIQIYSHMEGHKVVPYAATFPPMIEAFASAGDLSSAVECYNEYKTLAIADDSGEFRVIERMDTEVYAALVKAYTICDKADGGSRFLSKIVDSYKGVTIHRQERLEALQDTIFLDALIQERLDSRRFDEALKLAQEQSLTSRGRSLAMARICAAAADNNVVEVANNAYQHIRGNLLDLSMPAISMLALQVRQGNVESAREYWAALSSSSLLTPAVVEPTAMYAVALMGSGFVDEGLMQARQVFARIRASANASTIRSDITEAIDEGIEFIGSFLAKNAIIPSPDASMSFMWAMVENGGLVSPVAEQLLVGLGPEEISKLSWLDLTLALQVEAGLLETGMPSLDIAHSARFANLFETAIGNGMPLDKRTSELVERCLDKIGSQRPDLIGKWRSYNQPAVQQAFSSVQYTPKPSPAVGVPVTCADTFDPYATSTDYRGSTIIIEELESQKARSGTGLNDVLIRFRNMRRAGRHPRYIAYARLISAAAKEGRPNLVHDLLGMAKQDMPLLPQYRVVRHGWASILDAMIGACLNLGDRTLASQFHREMLDIGAAPTANTFGLYITTLKGSTKTFDEATEAVKIFQRAKSEGVEPSSFLYNALIGKLGKARRIDDCLFYFAEMRSSGIRPTSVTYGTIVNALCRVSDERFAEELFDEMESMPNYKPRPAPYNSLMQFFLTTKRDSSKVLAYYQRMQTKNIQPTMHTYKLLIDTYATLEPINMAAAEGVLDTIRTSGQRPEAVHYASLIHAKGCALHDMAGAHKIFNGVLADSSIRPQACLFQALFESMVANHSVADTEAIVDDMSSKRVDMTPYIANTLIHGWAMEKNIAKAKSVYDGIGTDKREPSTYEAMTRAFLTVEDRDSASEVVREMLSRGYPSAVSGKILELLGHGMTHSGSAVPSEAMA